MSPSAPLILNVDGDATKRNANSRILKGAGYEVIEAASGEAALRQVGEFRPVLMLLGVLPDVDGREVCRRIKADSGTAGTLVLRTCVLPMDLRDRGASIEGGADGFLVDSKEPEELLATVRALVRMQRAESELRTALDALREADQRRDEFLAMLAHELRNPMAPIRNAVEILRSVDPEVRERARTLIGRQIERLSRLVDDMLEVSRITRGKMQLQKGFVALDTVVQNAVDIVRPMAHARGQRVVQSLPAEAVWLEADAGRITQVLGNLLDNALKFSDAGSEVRLEGRVTPDAIELRVIDHGAGIPAEVIPRVFEVFAQGDGSRARSQGGLGIGLSLVKGLVELHGGSVDAQSAGPGTGSVFTVTLPIAARRAAPPVDAPRIVMKADRMRILVVEDNLDAAETMHQLLESDGHEVFLEHDGRVASETARALRPDAILLDIGLPGISGYDLARQLRQFGETKHARLIAISGYDAAEDGERSRAAGFDLHLVKPVDPERLREALVR